MYVPSEISAVRSSSEPEPSASTALSLAVTTTGRPGGNAGRCGCGGGDVTGDRAGHQQFEQLFAAQVELLQQRRVALHCQVSVSIGHCSRMLLAAVSRNSPVKRCVM